MCVFVIRICSTNSVFLCGTVLQSALADALSCLRMPYLLIRRRKSEVIIITCVWLKVQKMLQHRRRSSSSAKSYLCGWLTLWRNSVFCQNGCYRRNQLNRWKSGEWGALLWLQCRRCHGLMAAYSLYISFITDYNALWKYILLARNPLMLGLKAIFAFISPETGRI